MKNLFGLLFIAALFSLASCGGDDCDEDLSGTYTGSNVCLGLDTEEGTVTISGTDGNYSISGLYERASLDQSGCELSWEVGALGITSEKVTISVSGNSITINQELLGVETCTFTGTK